jgi:ectoine hydroxylase-related dioxygenase (phytanoyl-CoA dioxygenase family)
MVGISKRMAAIAAVIAFGLVTVDDIVGALAKSAPSLAQIQDATTDDAVVQEAALRERAAGALRALTAKQAAKRAEPEVASVAAPNCREQTWPFYSGDCLVRDADARVPRTIRIVGIESVADRSTLPPRLQ